MEQTVSTRPMDQEGGRVHPGGVALMERARKRLGEPMPQEPLIDLVRRELDLQALYAAVEAKDWLTLSKQFLRGWHCMQTNFFTGVPTEVLWHLNEWVGAFLYWFTDPSFSVPEAHAEAYFTANTAIGSTVALTGHRTTDAWLTRVFTQENNVVKMLVLLNPRCEYGINMRPLFEANPWLVSMWWCYYLGAYQAGTIDETVQKNLKQHLTYADLLVDLRNFHNVFFGCSYVDAVADRPVKEKVNAILRERIIKTMDGTAYKNDPYPKSIAVVCGCWVKNHSVYRNQFHFIQALKAAGYRLTLVQCGEERKDLEPSLFDAVKRVFVKGDQIEVGDILENDFGLVYFPEVGMTMETVFLANMRLAPLMVSSYGHSCSTWGSQVDYWIGSKDVEEDITRRTGQPAQDRYSERLLLIPGLGIGNTVPDYERRGRTPADDGTVWVACSWFAHKCTREDLLLLKDVREEVRRRDPAKKVKFRFFSGGVNGQGVSFICFARDIQRVLGEDSEVVPPLSYQEYMTSLEQCDLAVEIPSWGGVNTIADSLWVGHPVLSCPGGLWRNSTGAQMTCSLGHWWTRDRANFAECIAGCILNLLRYGTTLTEEVTEALTRDNKASGCQFASVISGLLEGYYDEEPEHQSVERYLGLNESPPSEPLDTPTEAG